MKSWSDRLALALLALLVIGSALIVAWHVSQRARLARPLLATISSNVSATGETTPVKPLQFTTATSAAPVTCYSSTGSSVTTMTTVMAIPSGDTVNDEIRRLLRDRQVLVERLREYEKREALDREWRHHLVTAGLTVQLIPRRSHPRVHKTGAPLR